MSKLYKLKEWFSLEDAAKRLSIGLGEPVSMEDVLQLAIEGHLPLSWFARYVPAERVARVCFLHYLMNPVFEKDEGPKDYLGPVTWHGDCAYRAHAGLKKGDVLKPYATLAWWPIHGKQIVEHIEGPYRLELAECGALKDWVHSLLTKTGGELIALDGYFVSDTDGAMWRILEYSPGVEYKMPDGTEKKTEPSYHPTGAFPDSAELVVQRSDIESFEERVGLGSQAAQNSAGARERRTLLNVIGGLLDLLLGKTTSGRPQSLFESQAAVIDALLSRHTGTAGFSKRTLESKLADAKRSLGWP